jgi:hypothetical protein
MAELLPYVKVGAFRGCLGRGEMGGRPASQPLRTWELRVGLGPGWAFCVELRARAWGCAFHERLDLRGLSAAAGKGSKRLAHMGVLPVP